MKKLKKKITVFVVFIIVALLVLRIDLTAHVFSGDGEILYWRGNKYVTAYGYGNYQEGATIARTRDGWEINSVVGDSEHNYIVIRSFLDQYLLVRENYEES